MKSKFLLLPILTVVVIACSETNPKINDANQSTVYKELDELRQISKRFFGTLPATAASNQNILSEDKVELGKKLYFDTRLSADNTISCNSCHNLNNGTGVDNLSFSPGVNGTLGGRNSPTVLNAAFHSSQFWDGRSASIEEQAGEPILNPVEMAMPSEKAVVDKLKKTTDYPPLFAKAFPDDADALSYANLELAIGAFERTLITPSRYDEFIAGNDEALTEKELAGLKTFIDAECTTCHNGKAFGGNMFQKFGLYGNYWEHTNSKNIDNGRFDVTQNESDKYMFKVPSLRNIAKTAPYFHDGSVADLGQAVKIMGELQTEKKLTATDVDNIVAFLTSLNGNLDPALIAQN